MHGRQAGSFAHARVLETSSGAVEGDVDIVADDGTLLVEIRGLHAKHLESAGEEPIANWLYELRWEEHPPEDADGVEAPTVGEWLVVGGDPKIAQELASALEAEGASCTVVPSEPERLDEAIGRLTPSCAGRGRLPRRVDAPATEGLSADLLVETQVRLCGEVRELATALAADSSGSRSLVLVTAGAEQAKRLTSPRGSPSRRSGARPGDRPRASLERCRLIDLPAGFSKGDLSALAAELLTTVPEEEIALRNDQRYVRRLRRLAQAELVPTMRASSPGDRFRAEIGTPGMLESVRMASVGRAEPGPGQVEIEVVVASLNFRDVMLAMGLLPSSLWRSFRNGPHRPRLRRHGLRRGRGSRGPHTPATRSSGSPTAPLPPTSPRRPSSSCPSLRRSISRRRPPCRSRSSPRTSLLVKLARLQPGERVLIHAATGGVGLAAIQVARDLGAEVFATAGTPRSASTCAPWGLGSRRSSIADARLRRRDPRAHRTAKAWTSSSTHFPARRSGRAFPRWRLRPVHRDRQAGHLRGREPAPARVPEEPLVLAVDLDRLLAEQPEYVGSIFQEVLAKFEDGTFEPPPRNRFSSGELSGSVATHGAGQAHRQGRRRGRRRTGADRHAIRRGPAVPEDGAYLVTGGLGGSGSRWRAGWSHVAREHWCSLDAAPRAGGTRGDRGDSSLGARVEVLQADVSRQEQAPSWSAPSSGERSRAAARDRARRDGARRRLAPQGLDDERFARVLAPKVAGAWNLHELTAGEPLDFFVSFSSISSLFGNVGQGNYAAANSLLDALAHYRRSRGLPR